MWNLVVLMLVMFVGPAYYVCCTLYRFLSEPSEPKPRIISNSTISNEKRISGEFKLVGHMCLDTEIEARAGVAVVLQDELPMEHDDAPACECAPSSTPTASSSSLSTAAPGFPIHRSSSEVHAGSIRTGKRGKKKRFRSLSRLMSCFGPPRVLDDNCALNPGTTEGSTSWELPSPSPSARHTSMSSIHAETALESCSSGKRAHEVPRCGPNNKLPGIPVGEDSARYNVSAMKVAAEGGDAAAERAPSGLHTLHQKACTDTDDVAPLERASPPASPPASPRAESTASAEYHPSSALGAAPGYLFSLTEPQREKLHDLMARCEGEGLVLSRWANWAGELPEQMGLRFLRARAWVVRRALHALRHDLAWRSKLTLSLRSQEGFESAGVRADSPEEACAALSENYPVWVEGHDREGRPVVYKPFGQWNMDVLCNEFGASPASLGAYHTWATDRIMNYHLSQASHKSHCSVEQVVCVLDAASLRWGFGLRSLDGINLTIAMVKLDADHYPERLGKMFIINVNPVFQRGWAIISRFLDKNTREKINIYTDKESWGPVLREAIGKDQLSVEYGGDHVYSGYRIP